MYEDIDDIEDLVAPGDLLPSDRYNNKKDIVIRKRKTTRVGDEKSDEKENECKNQQNGSVSFNCTVENRFLCNTLSHFRLFLALNLST